MREKKQCFFISNEYTHVSMLCSFSSIWLCDPMDYSPPGSSIQGILQERILKWVSMPSSMRSPQPRDWTHVSSVSWTDRWVLYHCQHLGSPTCIHIRHEIMNGKLWLNTSGVWPETLFQTSFQQLLKLLVFRSDLGYKGAEGQEQFTSLLQSSYPCPFTVVDVAGITALTFIDFWVFIFCLRRWLKYIIGWPF